MEIKKKSRAQEHKQLELNFEKNEPIRKVVFPTATVINIDSIKSRLKVNMTFGNKPPSDLKQIVESLISRYK
jgi:hypothetical protein